MKKVIVLLVILNLFQNLNVNGQAGNWVWGRQATGTDGTTRGSIATDAAGNVYATGQMDTSTTLGTIHLTSNHTGGTFFLVKYNSAGAVIWARNPGGTALSTATSVATDATGNVYVAGNYYGATSSGTYTFILGTTTFTCAPFGGYMFLVKYDASGNVLWATSPAYNQVGANSVATDVAGNIYVTGVFGPGFLVFGTTTLACAASERNTFLVKYDSSGAAIWAVEGIGITQGMSVSTDGLNNIYVTGNFYSPSITFGLVTLNSAGGWSDVFTVKYSEAGVLLWAKGFGGIGVEYASSIATDASGNVYVTGNFYDSIPFVFGSNTLFTPDTCVSYMYFIKYNTNGIEQWATEAGEVYFHSEGCSVSTDASGVFVSGFFSSTYIVFANDTLQHGGASKLQLFLVKYDFDGNVICAAHLDIQDNNTMVADAFDNAYINGTIGGVTIFVGTDMLNAVTASFVIAKYDCNSIINNTSDVNSSSTITLFPNPTSTTFTITSTEKIKEIKVFNVLGCEILKQVQNDQSATIDISGIAKGIYFVEIKTEKGVVRKKVVKE